MAQKKYEQWQTEEALELLRGWARAGLTDEDIATNMDIRRSTLSEWKNKYPDIADALKRGRIYADMRVENQLYQNAVGYTYTEQQAIKVKRIYWDKQGRKCEAEEVKLVEVVRYHPGETTAEIFWLKNRKPENWRDKMITEQEGPVNVEVEMFRGEQETT